METINSSPFSPHLPSVFAIRKVTYKFIDTKYLEAKKRGDSILPDQLTEPPVTSSQQSIVYGDKMYIFGGRSDSDDVFVYDMVENVLERLYTFGTPPRIRLYHCMNLDQKRDRFYLFGGVSTKSSNTYFNDLFIFDLITNTWTEVIPTKTESPTQLSKKYPDRYREANLPIPTRSGHAGVYREKDDCLVVYGGLQNSQKTSEFLVYSFIDECWYNYSPTNNDIVSARSYSNGQYCAHTDELIIFGGDTPVSLTGDTFILNFSSHTWTRLITNNPDPIYNFPRVFGHTSILLDTKGPPFYLIAYGGTSRVALDICYLFDITNRKWTCLNREGINFPKLNCCCLGTTGNNLFLYGGRDAQNRKSNDLYSMGLLVPSNIIKMFPRLSYLIANNYENLSDVTVRCLYN